MKIAAFVDEKGVALPFNAKGSVMIYVYENDEWYYSKKIPFGIDESMNLNEMHHHITQLAAEMGDCKLLALETIKGLPLSIFEGLGIKVWRIQGFPVESLYYIKSEVDKVNMSSVKVNKVPVLSGGIGSGIYKIDLVEVLKSDGTLTAKKVLFPFFRETQFHKLEIICEHPPKFFEKESEELKLLYEIEESMDGLYHINVFPSEKFN